MKPPFAAKRSGFGLLGLIVLLAVLAILAGTVGPLLFREYVAAREAETRAHLEALNQGLVAFYRDTGRLPTEAEGLVALVTDPGADGWRGPYVGSAREAAADIVAEDAWSRPLAYDRTPLLSTGQAAAIIVSAGGDRRLGSGAVGGVWTVGGTADGTDGHDDLQMLVDTNGATSEMEALTRTRMEAISQAAQEHFRVQGRFPDYLSDLSGAWLPPAHGADALVDGWGMPMAMTVDAAAHPPAAVVTSRGSDGEAGSSDDLSLAISSAASGRRTSLYELGIAQAAVDGNTSLSLTGNWSIDRAALGLADFLATDGWGIAYALRVSTRTVLSAGPDADYLTAADNIPPGVVPDGGAPQGLVLVAGTGAVGGGGCKRLSFSVRNAGTGSVAVTSLTLTWAAPAAYFDRVKVGGQVVFDSGQPRIGTGTAAVLDTPATIAAGQTVAIEIYDFKVNATSGGANVSMANVQMTITFPDGSVVTFNTGAC